MVDIRIARARRRDRSNVWNVNLSLFAIPCPCDSHYLSASARCCMGHARSMVVRGFCKTGNICICLFLHPHHSVDTETILLSRRLSHQGMARCYRSSWRLSLTCCSTSYRCVPSCDTFQSGGALQFSIFWPRALRRHRVMDTATARQREKVTTAKAKQERLKSRILLFLPRLHRLHLSPRVALLPVKILHRT